MSFWAPQQPKTEYVPTLQDKAFCQAEGCIAQVRDPETREYTYLNRCPRCYASIDTGGYQLQYQRGAKPYYPEQYYDYT